MKIRIQGAPVLRSPVNLVAISREAELLRFLFKPGIWNVQQHNQSDTDTVDPAQIQQCPEHGDD